MCKTLLVGKDGMKEVAMEEPENDDGCCTFSSDVAHQMALRLEKADGLVEAAVYQNGRGPTFVCRYREPAGPSLLCILGGWIPLLNKLGCFQKPFRLRVVGFASGEENLSEKPAMPEEARLEEIDPEGLFKVFRRFGAPWKRWVEEPASVSQLESGGLEFVFPDPKRPQEEMAGTAMSVS